MKRVLFFARVGSLCLIATIVVVGPVLGANASLFDLGTLGGRWSRGRVINDAEQVAGESETATGESHGFLYSGGVMTDLGTLTALSGGLVEVSAINDAGQVVGNATAPYGSCCSRPHAFLYSAGVMTDLGTLGGEQSQALAINNVGQVVGTSSPPEGGYSPFLYSDGVMTDLGTLGGPGGEALAINDAGQVVGYAATSPLPQAHAFLYSAGVMTDLGTLGGEQSQALAINNVGQVVGWSQLTAGDYLGESHAFLYSHGVMTDLGTLGGHYSRAVAINNAGQVVGWAETAGGSPHGFLYSDGVMTDLGTLLPSGTMRSWAVDINDSGRVLVNSATAADLGRAFVYSAGVMTDLGTLPGVAEIGAEAINNVGQVVGSAHDDQSDFTHAFLARSTCGNGAKEIGEQCDDGNLIDGDCCSSACLYEANGSPCPTDGDPCTVNTCDGTGSCGQIPTGCKTAGKSLLLVRNNTTDDSKDRLVWKWLKGAATSLDDLGLPTGTTNFTLCLYAGARAASVAIPAGSSWQAAGTKGFKFKDPFGTSDGAQKAVLKSGAAGKAEVLVKGKGANLPDTLVPALPLPVTAQLVNDTSSTCFEATYNTAIKNDAKQFEAKTP